MMPVTEKEIEQAVQSMFDMINSTANNTVKNATFDKTRKGRVVEVLPNGKYSVVVDGYRYKNVPSFNGELTLNSIVNVVFPENQTMNMYIGEVAKRESITSAVYTHNTGGTGDRTTVLYSNGIMECSQVLLDIGWTATALYKSTNWWTSGALYSIGEWYLPNADTQFIKPPAITFDVQRTSNSSGSSHIWGISDTAPNIKGLGAKIMILSDSVSSETKYDMQIHCQAIGKWK